MTGSEEESQGPVIRDRRRIDPVTGAARHPSPASAGDGPAESGSGGAAASGAASGGHRPGSARPGKHAVSKPAPRADTAGNGAPPAQEAQAAPGAGAAGAESAALLAERTADLQRLQAEYANYRKRVERDRAGVRELALASVLAELLPILDDIGRAREHGELAGGFKAVAESLEATTAKLGLTTYGEVGELFDPTVHEALMHSYSPDVTEPTCVMILQPGYRVGERIVRPARVAVAEPTEAFDVPADQPAADAGRGQDDAEAAGDDGGSAE